MRSTVQANGIRGLYYGMPIMLIQTGMYNNMPHILFL